jgi:hypothetical protein
VKLRGRHYLALWLLALLITLWSVSARQASSFRTARALVDLRDSVGALEARKAELERRIRNLSSRAVLVPLAQQRLHLRLPADSELRFLPVTPGGTRPSGPR